MLHDSALIVFAKHPAPGRVKTRLIPPFTPDEAAGLYRCMLLDTLEKVRLLTNVQRFLFYQDEPAALPFFRSIAPDFVLEPQKGLDLGERMAGAFLRVLSHGHRQAVVIGSDSPHLPVDYLRRSFQELDGDQVDAVFGPTADGGYYLLGLKSVPRPLFSGIAWSTGTVLTTSLERAHAAGLRTRLLPQWHDVDLPADLERSELQCAANGAPLTREFVSGYRAG